MSPGCGPATATRLTGGQTLVQSLLDSLCNTSQAAQEQEASFRMEGAWEGAGSRGTKTGAVVAKIHGLLLRFRAELNSQIMVVLTQCCKMPGGF